MKIKKDKSLRGSEILKSTVIIFLPLALIAGIVMFYIYREEVVDYINQLESDEKHYVDVMHEKIVDYFRPVISDLRLMSSEYEIHVMNEYNEVDGLEVFSNELFILSANSKAYKTVRFIDENGMEVIRVNREGGKPYFVAKEALQSKSDRYYFKEIFNLRRGEVYASPFDLNIEHGEIEDPPVPIIRFGTPLFYRDGRKRGILIINYFGQEIIDSLKDNYDKNSGRLMLLDDDGYWLKGADVGDEWGFMYEDRKEKRFGKAYPEVWQRISESESGEISSAEGLFTFQTVYPLIEGLRVNRGLEKEFNAAGRQGKAREYRWKLISYIPPDVLAARANHILTDAIKGYIIIVMLMALFSLFLARAGLYRKKAETVVRANEKKYRTLLENLPQRIFLKDKDSTYISCNSNYAGDLGIEPDDIAGKNDYDFFPKELADKYRVDDQRIRETGVIEDIVENYVQDGEDKYIHIIKVPVEADDGGGNLLGLFWDITDEKMAEEKVEKAYDELLEKSERLEKFHRLTVGRELDMMSLKEEVNDLLDRLGEPGRYRALSELESMH